MAKRLKAKRSTDNRLIEVSIRNGMAIIDPAPPELLSTLQYEEISFHGGKNSDLGRKLTPVDLFVSDDEHRLAVPTGLVKRICASIAELGYHTEVTDRRVFGDLHRPDADYRLLLNGDDADVADALVNNPIGQIQVMNDDELVRRIALIYRVFPAAQIVIALYTKGRSFWLWRKLQRELIEPIGLINSATRRCKGRCQILSYKRLNCIQPGEVQILLFPDLADVVGSLARETISRLVLEPIRLYGFVVGNQKLSTIEMLKAEAVAGCTIASTIPVVSAEVIVSDAYSTPQAQGLHGLERKRVACWENKRRNLKVTEVAVTMAARGITAARNLGLLLGKPDNVFDNISPGVGVLVESVEHGRHLQKLLPGWGLISNHALEAAGNCIITVTAASLIKEPIVGVLIVASGGDALPQLSSFMGAAKGVGGAQIWVVDFADDFDDLATDELKQRVSGYVRSGYGVEAISRRLTSTYRLTKGTKEKLNTHRGISHTEVLPIGGPTIAGNHHSDSSSGTGHFPREDRLPTTPRSRGKVLAAGTPVEPTDITTAGSRGPVGKTTLDVLEGNTPSRSRFRSKGRPRVKGGKHA